MPRDLPTRSQTLTIEPMNAHRRSVLCLWTRHLARKGWSVADIAALHQVSKADVRSMLAPPAVRPPNPKHPGAHFKQHNAWSEAAAADPRYRDRLELPELLEALAAELVDRPAAEPAPGSADPPPPVAASWGSPYASGPRKITPAVLAAAAKLHQEGESWPALARRFGCSRMAFYHALRRPPR